MSAWIDGAWTLLGDASLKAALVVAAAWIALAVGRPRNASVRHGVWAAALGAMLALPWLTLIAPRVAAPAGWYPRWSAEAASGAAADRELKVTRDVIPIPIALTDGSAVVGERAPSNPTAAAFERASGSAAAPQNLAPQATSSSSAAAPSASATSAPVERTDSNLANRAKAVLVMVYLGVASILVVRLAAGLWTTRRIVNRARAAATPLAEELLPVGTRLLESQDVVVPVATGLGRPAVLLPADWRSWGEPLLRCVLAHEAAHVRRRDPWVAALAALNRAAYWFHPAAWLVERRLAALAEQVCDDAVIEATGQRAGYARELVAMAGRVARGLPRVAPAGVAMARRASVEDRVAAIVDEARPLARRMDWRRVAALAAVAAPIVVIAAGLQAQVAKPQGVVAKPQAAEGGGAGEESDAEPEPVLSGRLVDETGAPVTDARVSLSGPDYLDTKVDAGGGYRFDALEKPGEYTLLVESARWVGFTRLNEAPKLQLTPESRMVRDFELQRACIVRLRTVDEASQPLDGVRVLPMPANIEPMNWPNGLVTQGARSDKDGWVELGLPRSDQPYHLATMSDDYAIARIGVMAEDPSVTQLLSIVLTRGVELRGTAICSDGKPAAGWSIHVVPAWWNFTTSPKYAPIDAEGSFTLPHVAPGRHHISIAVPTGDGTTRVSRVVSDVELPPPSGILELKINEPSPQSMGIIAGRVRIVGGTPAQGVSIYAVSESGRITAHGDVDRGGNSFRVAPLPPGPYRVTFSAPDVEEKVLRNVTAPVDDLEVELQYMARPKLRGRVTLADGSPATKFAARVEKLRTLRGDNYVVDPQWREIEHAAGEMEFEVPGPGVYRLVARAEGYAATRSAEINTDDDEGQPASLVLSAGATLTGTVVDDAGTPIAGARLIPLTGYALASTRQAPDVESLGVATDDQGRFRLEQLTPGQELLRASHPDFAFKTVPIESLKSGDNRMDPIALSRGGKVVGRVFDAEGRPLPGVQLSIRQQSGWNETAFQKLTQEFAVVTTDREGRYEADRLPAELCYVVRSDPWSSLGVVRHAIRPANGETRTLDLGGERPVRGRLLVNGAPVASTRIQINETPNFGAFQAYAMTDAEGRFTFWSPAAGKRTLYYAAPGRRNEWVVAAKVTIPPNAADIGDLDVRTSTVAIAVRGLSDEDAATARVTLEAYDPNWLYGDDGGIPQARAGANDPFVFSNVLPGEYEASCSRPDGVTMLQRVTVPASGERVAAEIVWPEGTASVAGPLNDAIFGLDEGVYSPPTIWKKDGTLLVGLYQARYPQNKFEIKGLPAGEYLVTSYGTRNPPPAIEFTLAPGEEKSLDLIAEGFKRQVYDEGVLRLKCYTVDGVPLPGCEISLASDGQLLTPHSSQEGRVVLTGPEGTYRMTVKFPGMETVERDVALTRTQPAAAAGDRQMEVRMRAAR